MYNTLYNKMNYSDDIKKSCSLNKCSICGGQTLLTTCIKCLTGKKQEIKKSNSINIKSIMDIHKIKLIKQSKNPCAGKPKGQVKSGQRNWAVINPDEKITKSFLEKNNWGILCNKANGILGVDLDTHKWTEEQTKTFTDKFGNDYIKKFSTYTQSTPKGGLHLVFQYDKDIDQTQSKKSTKFGEGIDIRNGHGDAVASGGYLVGAGSIFKKEDGTFGKYEIVLNEPPKSMPDELKEWLLQNIYTAEDNIKNQNKKIQKNHILEIQETKNQYDYFIDDATLCKEVLDKLPISYYTEYEDWLKMSSMMKVLNKPELWKKYSKEKGGNKYNESKNNACWNNIKIGTPEYPNALYVEYIVCKVLQNHTLINNIKYKKVPDNTIEPNEIINRKKLSQMGNDDKDYVALDLNKLKTGVVIKSDTGTGKTTLMKRELQSSGQRFVSIVSRISLGKEQYDNFNQYGVNTKFYGIDYARSGDSMITTIDSIGSCMAILSDIKHYTIFIDEFNSVLEYIFQADTCLGKSRAKCWQILIYMIKNCKNFICVDADISDICINFLSDMGRDFKYIKNEYKHNKGVIADEVQSTDFFKKMHDTIKEDGKLIVACDSKREAEYIFIRLGLDGNEQAKLLTGATDRLDQETLDDYEIVVFSPAVIYGLDSTMNRKVFCYYKEHTISPTNMLQQIARCRDIKHLYYCFDKKQFKESEFIDFNHCEGILKEKKEWADLQFGAIEDAEIERQNLFNKLFVKYKYKIDCFNTNKYVWCKKLLSDRGFEMNKIIYSKPEEMTPAELKQKKETIEQFKLENLDFESEKIQDFNEKYLGKLKLEQLKELTDLFVKDDLMFGFFGLKKYMEQSLNKETEDDKGDYIQLTNDDYKREVSAEELLTYSQYNYSSLSNIEEIKSKKIDTQQYKFYIIDYLKSCSGYVMDKRNVISCKKVPTSEEAKNIIKMFKMGFNFRGKTDPKLKTTYDCEKLIHKMMKETLPKSLFKEPKKVRDGKLTKYLYQMDLECDVMKYVKMIINFQRENDYERNQKMLQDDDELFEALDVGIKN